jgi:hypothetical protein
LAMAPRFLLRTIHTLKLQKYSFNTNKLRILQHLAQKGAKYSVASY